MKRDDLSLLFSRVHSTRRSILSVYLNVDQSQRANLGRGFETELKKMASAVRRSPMDVPERERFEAALHHIQDFVSAYSPAAKGLVLFFDVSDGFFWHEELEFPVTNQSRWDRELFLQLLANAMDQLEAYGVVLVDRAKARFFSVAFGKLEEVVHEQLDAKAVRHPKTTGTDHIGSSSRVQRKADNQVRMNLRRVVKDMERLAKETKLQRFVLAGTPGITAELRNLLPARLALRVIGEADIASNAAPAAVLSVTQSLAEKYEQGTEVEKVSKIVTSAAKKGKAVVGLGRTLKAINSDRVWELVYSGGFLSPGHKCAACSALFSARSTRCTYCGSRIQPVSEVVERAVEHVVRKHAKVEVVTGEAAAALKMAGGIGAFLKTRTGTLEA
jgi:peptide subunit release factor 1 (eRF1)